MKQHCLIQNAWPHFHSWDDYDRLKGYSYRDYSESIQYDAYGKLSGVTIQDQFAAGGGFTRTYTYAYKNEAAHELDSITTGTYKFSPQTDKLGRNAGREICNNDVKLAGEYIYYRKALQICRAVCIMERERSMLLMKKKSTNTQYRRVSSTRRIFFE